MEVHVTIDFMDDVLRAGCDWTEELLRAAIRDLAAKHVSAAHWIDVCDEEGHWDPGWFCDDHDPRMRRMIERIPRPLDVLCDEAHRAGMRVYAVLKPHDMVIGEPFAGRPFSQVDQTAPPLPHIGGAVTRAARWIREHPDKRMRLHPALDADDNAGPITTIRLWHEGATLDRAPDVRIWTSPDNGAYRLLSPCVVRRDEVRVRRPPLHHLAPEQSAGPKQACHCIELAGLNLVEPYVGLEIAGHPGLANTLGAVAELFDAEGRAIPFTLGLVPRQHGDVADRDWRRVGVAFDACRGLPLPGRGCTGARSCFDRRVEIASLPCLAFARGRNRYLTAPVELAWPEVQDWLLRLVERELDSGVDGVDLRFDTHTESLDWDNYGFSEPVVDAFRQRHGVDVTREPFCRAAWRRLRGEYVERLLSRAAQAVRARDGELFAHVNNDMRHSADEFSRYECFWDWPRWIEAGLLDGVTFKSLKFRGDFEARLHEVCRRAGVKRIACEKPALHRAGHRESDRQRADMLETARRKGYDVFNAYELATYARLGADGRLVFEQPAFWSHVARQR